MAKDKKGVNPAEQFRKQQKKKGIKKAQEQRKVVREVRSLLNDPEKIEVEIVKYQKLSNENKLDKSLKDKILELKNMKSIALKKQQIEIVQGRRPKADDDEDDDSEGSDNEPAEPQSTSSVSSSSAIPPPSGYHQYPYPGMAMMPSYPSNMPFNPAMMQYPGRPPLMYMPNGNIPPPPPPRPGYGGIPAPRGVMGAGGRGGMVIGGMNGIPPPPPRPMGRGVPLPIQQQMQQQHQQQLSHLPQNRRENKRKRANEEEFDPLDPAGRGYTERFGKKALQQQQLQSEEDNEAPMDTNKTQNIIPSSVPMAEEDGDHQRTDVSQSEQEGEDNETEEQQEEEEKPEINAAVAPLSQPVSSFPVPFSVASFGNFTINREEIMRRRLQLQADNNNITAVEIPKSKVEENNEDEEEKVGPSRPPTHHRQQQIYVEDVSENEENDNEDEDEDEKDEESDEEQEEEEVEEIVGPARPNNSAVYHNYYSAVPENAATAAAPRFFTEDEINNSEEEEQQQIPTSNAKKPGVSLLPGMDYYSESDASSSDSEEDQEYHYEKDIVSVAQRPSEDEEVAHHSEPQRNNSNSYEVKHLSFNNNGNSDTAMPLPSFNNNPTVISSHQSAPKEEKPVLKVMKLDSALTSLVPNVVKKKIAAKPPLKPTPPASAPPTSSVPLKSVPQFVPVTKPSQELDSAYEQFLADIDGL
jgi:hypothetical protein